jgi:hypothetical protein
VRGAATVDVDYDEAYAFPRTIYIDQSKNVIDEEVQYKVENFTTLSPAAITYPADKEKE